MAQRELIKQSPFRVSSRFIEQIPNSLSLFRLFSAPLIGWMILTMHPLVLPVFIISGITDWLDGFAARRLDNETHFGRLLDPLADKVLISAVFLCFYQASILPFWFIGVILARDIFIVLGGFFVLLKKIPVRLTPSWVSKVNTFFQLIMALLIILSISLDQPFSLDHFSFESSPLFISITFCGIIVLITTVLSGLAYFWTYQTKIVEYYLERAIKDYGDKQ